MSSIKILDSITTNQIAAGEVVERPASVIKELCENSLDANASIINIIVKDGGINSIEISDNGTGMDEQDLKLACERHATSKLTTVDDFLSIRSMGFRGEALASIAAVSKLRISSRKILSPKGYFLYFEGGQLIDEGSVGMNEGTILKVESIFYNTPARYKFLKKDSTEISYIKDIVERFILSRPDVSFKLKVDGQDSLHSPGNNDLKSAIFSIYGKSVADSIVPLEYQSAGIIISGYVGKPEISRKTRKNQSFFVNSRYIKSSLLSAAVDEAYKTLIMRGQFPFCVINIDIDPANIDINVHPQKTSIKFGNESDVFRAVMYAIKEALMGKITIPEITKKPQIEENQIIINNTEESNKVPPRDNISKPYSFNEKSNIDYSAFEKTKKEEKEVSIEEKQIQIPEMQMISNDKTDLISNLAQMNYKGSLFNTYLIFELKDEIILIDQHAAHERIIFEELLTSFQKKEIKKQMLISPLVVNLPASEVNLVEENLTILSNLGFECEKFGEGSIILRTVPMAEDKLNPENAVKSVIDSLGEKTNNNSLNISQAIYSMSCKAAVKAHDCLKIEEINSLIKSLVVAERNTHCPHGRPTAIRLTRYEIEKWFKRVTN